jgi:Alpha/beta hydrolase domain
MPKGLSPVVRDNLEKCPSAAIAAVSFCVLLASLFASSSHAEIVKIVIDRHAPVDEVGKGGQGTAYEEIRGRLFGEVDPELAENAIIQDIDAAPRNARGKVVYISTFTLLRPIGATKTSGVLLAPIPNRGHRTITSQHGRPGSVPLAFFERGYSILWVGWQADLPEHPAADVSAADLSMESMLAPRARRPNGQPITGPYLIRVPTLGGNGPNGPVMRLDQGRAGALAYMPLDFDTRKATLTGGPAEDINGKPTGPRYTINARDWTWWNCRTDAAADKTANPADLCVKRVNGAFIPRETYLLRFTARDPLVMGLGMAAIRDAVSFFRYGKTDSVGTANPMAGRITHVVAQGMSQVGNLVKTFIALGFNRDESGRRVWDGANAHIAGRRTPINYRFSTPGSSPTMFMPGSEGVLWWGKSADSLYGGPPRSMLDRCEANATCPRIFETFGGSEFWNQRITPGLVGFDLKTDIPLPAEVRRYYFPSTQHNGGTGGFSLAMPGDDRPGGDGFDCALPLNPNPEDDQMRALMIALVDWVSVDKEPPPSAYPSLARKELVRDEPGELRFPAIPGSPSPYRIANPVLVYDFGDRFSYLDLSGVVTRQPPAIRAVIPALVPQVNADGNETGGVPSVQLMAPLGTFLSWNTYREGPYAGQICSYLGGFVPFARTSEAREAASDPRPSIEERYHTRRGYLEAVSAAVAKSEHDGFLLPSDGERLLREATEATESGDLRFLPPWDRRSQVARR